MTMTLLILTMMFTMMKHPLSMGMTLLMSTTNVAIISSTNFLNSWFSYMMFLIMIGGMLVLFIYMTSIASNEKFKVSMKILMTPITVTIMTTTLNKIEKMKFMKSTKTEEFQMMTINENTFLSKFMNFPNSMIIMMLIIYLLIAMIAVVKITNIEMGPLRKS
uniref:NADH-ubiquinone oxidoreductase chain 6 n=1 Tax=Chelonarium sp. BMNH 840450 TaxID=1903803 RepID=A0A343A3I1_9COLE|nr:NADH dehydrogenase subunit 6 [Chelonarium sp. BMNH 840450]